MRFVLQHNMTMTDYSIVRDRGQNQSPLGSKDPVNDLWIRFLIYSNV